MKNLTKAERDYNNGVVVSLLTGIVTMIVLAVYFIATL